MFKKLFLAHYTNKLKSWFSAASAMLQIFRPRLGPSLLALPLALDKKSAAPPCRIPNFSVCLCIFILFSSPSFAESLQSDIDRAVVTIRDFKRIPESSIPDSVLKNAKGLVIVNEVKGGFIFSGGIGSGLVIARLDNGWSAPSAIGTGSVGWGFQIGGEVTDLVLVLNTKAAVDAFAQGGSITLGGNLSIAAGPIGRTAAAALSLPPAAIYTYSVSRGAFGGVSLQGAAFVERASANSQFYGFQVTPSQLLFGQVQPPQSAQALYNELNQY